MEDSENAANALPEGIVDQHRHLATLVERLRRAHEGGKSWEDLARMLDVLMEDVKGHFASEEAAMERGSYPRLAEHQQAHRLFVRRIHALRLECDRRQTELMSVLTELLESWFKHHEATLDRHAMEFLGLGS